jgi:preprotein translocase subunit SecG
MQTVITVLHILVAVFLIVVVLLQSGKGGGIGSLGGSNTNVFGARGAGNFLTKMTAACAVIFFLTSLTLSIMSSKTGSVVQGAIKPPPAPTGTADVGTPPAAPEHAATGQPSSAPAVP